MALYLGGVKVKINLDNIICKLHIPTTVSASMKNWVKYSTESDGTTIYNGGLGYKDGYRVRSGGAEATNDYSTVTGYIPAKAGDVIRIGGANFAGTTTSNAINVSDASFTNIGQVVGNVSTGYGIFASTYSSYGYASVVEESTGIFKWVVPPDSSIAYIRVTAETYSDGSAHGENLIVTVNEEITNIL